jgi:hypothetical protein
MAGMKVFKGTKAKPGKAPVNGKMHPHHAHVSAVAGALHGSDPYKHHK